MSYLDLFRATLPETALEVAALLTLIVDLGFLRKAARKTRLAAAVFVGVLGCAGAFWAAQATVGSGLRLADGELALAASGIATVAQLGMLALTALTLLLLAGETFTNHVGEFVALVLLACVGGLLVAAARDLLIVFAALELLSLSLYILTAFAKGSSNSAEAGLKYYLFGGMSAAFLLYGFSLIYGITGATNFSPIGRGLAHLPAERFPLFFVALVTVAAGLGFKVAAAPFHQWAPDAYQGAPAPAAAFLASVSKVASFALLLGILAAAAASGLGATISGAAMARSARMITVALAVASMTLGNLAALAQSSARRLLAYSAIAHAGYLLLGLAYFSGRGAGAILYYALTYALTTVGAFGVVAQVERAMGSDSLDAFAGLSRKNPLLAAVLLVLLLSLAGIPPLVGFWAKFNLFAAVLAVSGGVAPFTLVFVAIAAGAVSLYYYLQVLKRAFVTPALDSAPIAVPWIVLLALMAIALAVVLLGLFPAGMGNWIQAILG